jgi:leucine dehydrogenase
MDIYAPCALGATLNSNSIPKLKCQIIAGGANNQLEDEVIHAQMLKEKNIVYMPDFLINSGGIINVYLEYSGNYDRELAYQKAEDIYSICGTLLKNVDLDSTTTHQAAMQMARNRIDAIQ